MHSNVFGSIVRSIDREISLHRMIDLSLQTDARESIGPFTREAGTRPPRGGPVKEHLDRTVHAIDKPLRMYPRTYASFITF